MAPTMTMAAGNLTPARKAAMVLAGTGVLTLAAQVTVPFYPVPMTLQTLAVLSIGLTFGSRLGVLTVLAWYGEALMGLPVLANFSNGAAFAGPTAGFLAGFVAMAWLAGRAVERGITGPVKLSLVTLALSAMIYLPGLAWPAGLAAATGIDAGWTALSVPAIVSAFALPFLLADAVKAVLAALLHCGLARRLARR
ncbi:biotin transporter BioY [uncultured Jannaschia sp.]|uniref:biotin transporter BioY n=1 Tax=uncultured Jannaschia sp. TaxID=293347 RepID=UPI002629EA3D|nr:biotin transporter BioY [uncultured Jannaschia sp.]